MNTITIVWLSVLTIAFIVNYVKTREGIKGILDVATETYRFYADFQMKEKAIKTEKENKRVTDDLMFSNMVLMEFRDYLENANCVEDVYSITDIETFLFKKT